MSDSRTTNLTSGNLLKQIILFTLPLIASGVLQQLFNSCDIAVVGRFVGAEDLAAVGSTSPLINLILNVFIGLGVGANVLIASLVGQKKTELISSAVHTVILLAVLCGTVLGAVGIIFSSRILVLIETPHEVLPQAALYLKIYFTGFPFIMIYNFGSSILRGRGESFKPAVFLIVAGILNVFMNLFFVLCLHMGAEGVGIATTLANLFSAACIIITLAKEKGEFKFSIKKLAIDKRHSVILFKIGMPAGIQGIVFSLSNLVIQGALNSLGPKVMAGSASGVTFEIFAYFIVTAFVQCAVTFTSQNYGAGNLKRCYKAFFYCIALSVGFTMVCSLVFTLFRFRLSEIYSSDPETIRYSAYRILKVESVQFLINSYEITAGVLRGFGCSLTPAIITIAGTCAVRLLWIAFVFPKFNTYGSVLMVYPVSWVITGSAMILTLIIFLKKKINKNC